MKKICVITMIRNEEFFLPKWINYYGLQLGEENLYVYLDGKDQTIPDDIGRAHIIPCDRIGGQVVSAEKSRLSFLSNRAMELLKEYDLVIGVDIDEFLVVDPILNKTLQEYLNSIEIKTSLSGLGLDVGQHLKLEKQIDGSKPFLNQRGYAVLSARYTKPSIISKPVVWGSGFHRIKGHNYKIDKNLYLFHFGCIDMKFIEDRFKDKDRLASGWGKHMEKRARTITLVTEKKAKSGEKMIPFARRVQSIFRPIFAWNKPTMFTNKTVITIPKRFRDIL